MSSPIVANEGEGTLFSRNEFSGCSHLFLGGTGVHAGAKQQESKGDAQQGGGRARAGGVIYARVVGWDGVCGSASARCLGAPARASDC